jgi:hypothetical protein
MPRGAPFTALCQLAARLARPVVADLHLHTTASDGEYTPSQLVAFARQARLDAIAVTDHDTFAGVEAAVEAARGSGVRVIPGVELTAEWGGREVHVLGYFPDGLPRDDGERAALAVVSRLNILVDRRRERFGDFVRLIRAAGHRLDDGLVAAVEATSASLGRRHVAGLLVRAGVARTWGEAWGRFVAPLGGRVVPKLRLPFAEATGLVRQAGGLSSLAHPPSDLSETELAAMRNAGLGAVEAKFPAAGVGRTATLRGWAAALGLGVTGGSDCHGGGRVVGGCGLNAGEWERFG